MLVLFHRKKRKNIPIILALENPLKSHGSPTLLSSSPPPFITAAHRGTHTYTKGRAEGNWAITWETGYSAIGHHGYTYAVRNSNCRSNLCSNLSLNHASFSTLIHPALKYICLECALNSFGSICNAVESCIRKITWSCIKKLKSQSNIDYREFSPNIQK